MKQLTLAASILLAASPVIAGQLKIESWRTDDAAIWQDVLIPAFNAQYPDIEVTFDPVAPADYDSELRTRLENGSAGDLITCRPFDVSLGLYNDGHLQDLTALNGIVNFQGFARSAWQTDDGFTTFCLPMASVVHGFFYNQDIFNQLGLTPPTTQAEFDAVLAAVKDAGITPMAMGTADQWEAATMGFQNIGPNYWKGEDGRFALLDGDDKFTDEAYVKTLQRLAGWGDYLGEGFASRGYGDAQAMFANGEAAIYPAGSWDIATFNGKVNFSAFAPPVENDGDRCYISDHTDIGMGINANSANSEEAQTFLNWMSGKEFAELYSNALPGFFSLSSHVIKVDDPVANTMINWRVECGSTIRNSYQILSRGEPNLERELWAVSAGVINGEISPEAGAARLQEGLDGWYEP
ncbi:ABC transporter substrate-binding protein [Salinibius halmophilus]|uniref:ABC transporter substrate-binding protein n=1 Tax=Salinibius halmophilus TaxID=1853216 RepID=UPI000E66F70C|nr:ABC transporter substrate-binding protein [Salinibius halmophilus]